MKMRKGEIVKVKGSWVFVIANLPHLFQVNVCFSGRQDVVFYFFSSLVQNEKIVPGKAYSLFMKETL